ncbi:hypothetical protein [Candidatus Albibeggiatoa sp. nov. NOAA]|uniref:hypothetical protein n=1 Tax=Candidatus Albibeggiatoa sp. nov. NOAA TaxID=3162724 RepID=UPI0032FD1708|nr:hypothetical protein [Thiotrichaceae bacterium]
MKEFNEIPFHDAAFKNILINWESKTITFEMIIFINSQNKRARLYFVTFNDVSHFFMPHHSPWGDSVFINSASRNGNIYLFNMQSGDTLEIHAAGFKLIPHE